MPKVDIDKLKRLRTAIPLTQPELAEKMGVKRSTYAYKEKIGEFTETEIQELVRIFQIGRDELVINEETNGNGSNGHKYGGGNYTGPPVDEIVRSKDETIATQNRFINFLEGENARLKKECETTLFDLRHYVQLNAARLKTVLECQKMLRALATNAKLDQKKIDEAASIVDKLFQENYAETFEGGID